MIFTCDLQDVVKDQINDGVLRFCLSVATPQANFCEPFVRKNWSSLERQEQPSLCLAHIYNPPIQSLKQRVLSATCYQKIIEKYLNYPNHGRSIFLSRQIKFNLFRQTTSVKNFFKCTIAKKKKYFSVEKNLTFSVFFFAFGVFVIFRYFSAF